MHTSVKSVIETSQRLFSNRQGLVDYWQTVGENFYPERANFTVVHDLGDEFMEHLTTSYPVLARRDLGNALSAMLRTDDWFSMSIARKELLDTAGKEWLEWAQGTQRRAMYDRATMFTRATKEGDHDFASFGQAVISVELNKLGTKFLYRCHHLRDVAWAENDEGKIDYVARAWEPEAKQLARMFPDKVHQSVKTAATKDPFRKIKCRHVVMATEMWEGGDKKWQQPYVSLYIDEENDTVLEEAGKWSMIYVIPRWQTVSGSQYAYSPATIAALPDARLIQAVTLTLLDAGEMHARPPMLAVGEAIRSDINLSPGAVTIVDADYDERLGEVLRPLSQDKSGIPFGVDIRNDVRDMIGEAFYLNKLSLPSADIGGDMTAFEVGQRVQEYIRQALPLFEPMETEYNGALCEATFDLGMRNGLFGPIDSIPESLQGHDVQFRFVSPLSEATERKDGSTFLEAKQLLAQAAELDPSTVPMLDAQTALRAALSGIGVPTKWTRDEKTMEEIATADAEKNAQAEAMASVQQGAAAVEQVGGAAEVIQRVQQATS